MFLFLWFMIGMIGTAYTVYGKKSPNISFLVFGIILIVYPYFTSGTIITIVLGIIFMIAPFFTSKLIE
jgi:hypothetical protein